MPFSKIMIALEKPPLAFKVAETGFALANALNAQVYLVHVNPSALLYTPDSGMSVTQIEANIVQQTEEFLNQITKQYGGSLKPITLVLEGNIEQELLTTIQDIQPELLVVGTHTKKPWKEMLLGSVSEELVRNATCPVMLIRESD